MNDRLKFLDYFSAFFISLVLIAVIIGIRTAVENSGKTQRDLKYYQDTYLLKRGATLLYRRGEAINYNLLSVDGGKSWYVKLPAPKTSDKNPPDFILKPVEEIYPGLMAHLDALDKLIHSVPLDIQNPDTVLLLREAGFEVRNKN